MSVFSAFTKQHSYSAAPHGPLTFELCRKAAEEYLCRPSIPAEECFHRLHSGWEAFPSPMKASGVFCVASWIHRRTGQWIKDRQHLFPNFGSHEDIGQKQTESRHSSYRFVVLGASVFPLHLHTCSV